MTMESVSSFHFHFFFYFISIIINYYSMIMYSSRTYWRSDRRSGGAAFVVGAGIFGVKTFQEKETFYSA